jgi:hypothetical protein
LPTAIIKDRKIATSANFITPNRPLRSADPATHRRSTDAAQNRSAWDVKMEPDPFHPAECRRVLANISCAAFPGKLNALTSPMGPNATSRGGTAMLLMLALDIYVGLAARKRLSLYPLIADIWTTAGVGRDGPEPASCSTGTANCSILLNYLIGDCNKVRRHVEAESLRCFQIDDQFIR